MGDARFAQTSQMVSEIGFAAGIEKFCARGRAEYIETQHDFESSRITSRIQNASQVDLFSTWVINSLHL
jgi:hypothetical protein